MKRFMGMMPGNEVEIEKTYKDSHGLRITIQSSKKGWTIIYADASTEYQDIEDTAENNLNKALEVLKSNLNVTEC